MGKIQRLELLEAAQREKMEWYRDALIWARGSPISKDYRSRYQLHADAVRCIRRRINKLARGGR